jgi:cytochrome subunit of sulfide dehydrogenase
MLREALVLTVAASLAGSAKADPPPMGAANCTGCHSSSDASPTTIPPIVGRNPAELVAAMEEFRTGQRPATIMDRLVKGFTPAEIQAIAAWLAVQK